MVDVRNRNEQNRQLQTQILELALAQDPAARSIQQKELSLRQSLEKMLKRSKEHIDLI